jgi:hypothetical protein
MFETQFHERAAHPADSRGVHTKTVLQGHKGRISRCTCRPLLQTTTLRDVPRDEHRSAGPGVDVQNRILSLPPMFRQCNRGQIPVRNPRDGKGNSEMHERRFGTIPRTDPGQ